MNKLTVNSQFLTIEQAKELKGLGIDFSDANFAIGEDNDLIILGCSRDKRYCPTLSVSEMIEMLPLDIEAKSEHYGNQTVYLSMDSHSVMYCVSGIEFEGGLYAYTSFEKPLLLDALFEMIKFLKKNKLI